MSSPPGIFDGNRNYSHPSIWRLVVTSDEVRLEPNPAFMRAFTATILLMAALVSGVCIWMQEWLMAGLAAIAMFIVWSIIFSLMQTELSAGPWLIFDRQRQQVRLPRQKLEVPIQAMLGWEITTGKTSNGDEASELNLFSASPTGDPRRHPLVGGYGASGLRDLVTALEQETGIRLLTADATVMHAKR